MEPSRHSVPERPEMFGIATADVLPATKILRRFERCEEVVVEESREWSFVIDGNLCDDSRFMNVVVLEVSSSTPFERTLPL